MKKTKVSFSIHDGGDGSAYPHWFLTIEDADLDQDLMVSEGADGWGENCTGTVQTYEESDIHKLAKRNSKELPKRQAALNTAKEKEEE